MIVTRQPSPTLSASSLKVFAECERLYEYTFVAPRPWPAPANQDQEQSEMIMEAGQRLHQLIHLHAHGLDPRSLARTDESLQRWYTRYKASSHAQPEGAVFSEQKLTFTVAGRKIVVKYDRVVQAGDRWLIIDWKTSRRVPDRSKLEGDWQARLYPFALAEAGHVLNGGAAIAPEQIDMLFFYLEAGKQEILDYGTQQHEQTRRGLLETIAAIARVEETHIHHPTGKRSGRCGSPPCRFYSLCHMAPMPVSEFRAGDDEAEAQIEVILTLRPEFEFDDEPVLL